MPNSTRESGGTLHVAVMGVNRIGKHDSLHLPIWIVNRSVRLDPTCERALFRCNVVEAAAVEFAAFLQVSCGLSLYGFQRL